jgi:hypothetical protein
LKIFRRSEEQRNKRESIHITEDTDNYGILCKKLLINCKTSIFLTFRKKAGISAPKHMMAQQTENASVGEKMFTDAVRQTGI